MQQNELQHYGVPGMKWGVRKSVYKSMNSQQRKRTRQNYQTEEWKKKQISKVDKKYAVDTWKKRSDKAVAKFDEIKADKYATEKEIRTASRKATKQLGHYYSAKGHAEIEKYNIQKMTLSDIRKEQAAIGGTYIAAVAGSMFVGGVITGTVAGAASTVIRQTNRGTNNSNSKKITEEAHKKAYKKIQGR
jgi:hypothetical protein